MCGHRPRRALASALTIATAVWALACGGRVVGGPRVDGVFSSAGSGEASTSTSRAAASRSSAGPAPTPSDGGLCPPGGAELDMIGTSDAQYCVIVAGPYGVPLGFTVEDPSGAPVFQESALYSCDTCTLGGNDRPEIDQMNLSGSSDLLTYWKGTQQLPGVCGSQGTSCFSEACAAPQPLVAHMCAWPHCTELVDGQLPPGTPTCVDVPFEYPTAQPVVGVFP